MDLSLEGDLEYLPVVVPLFVVGEIDWYQGMEDSVVWILIGGQIQ